eukprot:TRINITY_DN98776_c0_g1_i1.p3 TRINITY_DN98776_c0_g1~~TRINITY_DN98776_c0_g1_i1.p3  ORF type:complete len:146 (+),score=36.37 TRINITY_DN98776_c0_g1_i1:27-464(+)
MVVKTETCFYSELRIYPGHGHRVVRRDGKLLIFLDHKSRAHWINKKKAQDLRWSQAWRRAHKKVKVDKEALKKFVKKSTKAFKTFAGISLEDLKARQEANSEFKKAQRDAAARAKKAAPAKNKSEFKVQNKVPKFVAARMNAARK